MLVTEPVRAALVTDNKEGVVGLEEEWLLILSGRHEFITMNNNLNNLIE